MSDCSSTSGSSWSDSESQFDLPPNDKPDAAPICPTCREPFGLAQVLGAQLSGRMPSRETALEFRDMAERDPQHRSFSLVSNRARTELLETFRIPGPLNITCIEYNECPVRGTYRRPGRGEKESEFDMMRMLARYRQRQGYRLHYGVYWDPSVSTHAGFAWETFYMANSFGFSSHNPENSLDRFSRRAFGWIHRINVNTLVGHRAQEAFRNLCDQLATLRTSARGDYKELMLSDECVQKYLCHSFDYGHRTSLANAPAFVDLVLLLAAKLVFAVKAKKWNLRLGWGPNAFRYKWSCPFDHTVPGHRYPFSQLIRTECTQEEKDAAKAIFDRKYQEMVDGVKREKNFHQSSIEEVEAIVKGKRPRRPDLLSLKRKREATKEHELSLKRKRAAERLEERPRQPLRPTPSSLMRGPPDREGMRRQGGLRAIPHTAEARMRPQRAPTSPGPDSDDDEPKMSPEQIAEWENKMRFSNFRDDGEGQGGT
ncbi:uncharacterized protein BDZ99DRAFT_514175 [Mytilinidion resinicola]|uniref:Uncharacterized protein n=1 Tax=Mytilinidion resinicola TaxID=574789 RepID=A0A6A6ZCA8_9PEZI|nr:uncharacterized protein BDZ99DRAFT_514175 [Mytilinidion resinicola]KAF2817954.1 hypothetical protein BDZ99DRAFT_514175 [Mytilinidion resinicola]